MAIDRFIGTYEFLSNFYPCVIVYPFYECPIHFPSVEHFFQAMKNKDVAFRRHVARLPKAWQAKQAGRETRLREDWEEVKDAVMQWGIDHKFVLGNPLAHRLVVETEGEYLIEGNTWGDRYWGTCNGYGLNKLGHMLMAKRTELEAAGQR